MTDQSEWKNSFNHVNGEKFEVPIRPGEPTFISGANGTGKSSITQQLAARNAGKCHRIAAHRQVWFQSDAMDLTPADREKVDQQNLAFDSDETSRWKDFNAQRKSQVTIFDLINSDNDYNRSIAEAVLAKDVDRAEAVASTKPPIARLNRILAISNTGIQISIGDGSKLLASKNQSTEFGAKQLSDGERNALLIISSVLTAKPGTLIILDEPERHLHRTIISPLLTTLFEERPDCPFVIATHDMSLIQDNPSATAVLLREYYHPNKQWDADVIDRVSELGTEFTETLLGARRNVIFIEGVDSSLDEQLYSLLFPNVSVSPVENCTAVIRSVQGLHNSEAHHWVQPFGIVDRDGRSDADIESLANHSIAALEFYSVESVYYHPEILSLVAARQATIHPADPNQLTNDAISNAMIEAEKASDHLASKMTVWRLRESALQAIPSPKDLLTSPDSDVLISCRSALESEQQKIATIIKHDDFLALVKNYPVRESGVFSTIATTLMFKDRHAYESAVRKMIVEDEVARQTVRRLLEPATSMIDPKPAGSDEAAKPATVEAVTET